MLPIFSMHIGLYRNGPSPCRAPSPGCRSFGFSAGRSTPSGAGKAYTDRGIQTPASSWPDSVQPATIQPLHQPQKDTLPRMALGNPLSYLQQAFARLLARFHKKFLTFRSSFVGAWFDAAGAVAYSVVCNRPEHRCYQALPVRWRRPSQRLLECRHRLKSPLEADQSRLFVMRLGRLGCYTSHQVIQ